MQHGDSGRGRATRAWLPSVAATRSRKTQHSPAATGVSTRKIV
jgi:hypothetical protein